MRTGGQPRKAGMRLSVDGGPSVDLFQPRFTAYTPQTTVQLPVDNVWGVPRANGDHHRRTDGTRTSATFGVGRHRYTTEVDDADGFTNSFKHVINIVPRSHSEDDD